MSVRVRVCSRVPHVTSHYLMCVLSVFCMWWWRWRWRVSVRVRVCSRVPCVTSHYLMCVVNPLCVVVEVRVVFSLSHFVTSMH